MFSEFFSKFDSIAKHHQIFFTIIIAFCVIAISWGVEKILEEYVFYKNPLHGYIICVIGGLFMLYLVEHFILHIL